LSENHPRLKELRARYASHPAAATSLWSREYISRQISLPEFRAHNAFIWQTRTRTRPVRGSRVHEINYLLTAYYVRGVDRLRLLDCLSDDDAFGNLLVPIEDGFTVSRELLDSVLEIDFLERHLDLFSTPELRLLDIGAGYGRLAHRLVQSVPNLERVYCTDGVAESTFIAEYYLQFRRVNQKAHVVPLNEISANLREGEVQIATNIHSFSECPLDVINWWLALLSAKRIRHLFIVPNTGERLCSRERDQRSLDFAPVLREHGYELIAVEPKYLRSAGVQRHGLYPTHYHLFELRG
jgi:SAM-dependent methyltransferase